ncbi:MAG: DNA methyltransferase [Wendovervirus sonii]|uniref:DNA methyltransferase n=1 Tax=phage Lak_Megaphage_Sonny TaxID=3109229 RepID=A0ABZ0Z2X1_9CAUD|nr:MAG: DNA methyltransferase [phage Lak_Megaphage_Sonny]
MIEINKIYNEDCLEGMKKIDDKSIDCIICDLPYGTTNCSWDIVIPFDKLWEQYDRIIKDNGAIILFGQEPFSSLLRTSNIKDYRYDIYWEKERLTNIQQVKRRVGKTVECISIFYKKQCTYNPQMIEYTGPKRTNKIKDGKLGLLSDCNNKKPFEYVDTGKRYPTQVWKFKRDILVSNIHPTQKPLALIQELIRTFSNEGDLILDNCMGSGTTAVAAIKENRNFIGFELDKEYFNNAEERIIQELNKN